MSDLTELTNLAASFMSGINLTTYKGEPLKDPYEIEYDNSNFIYNSIDRFDLIDYWFQHDIVSLDDVLPLSKAYYNGDLKDWFQKNGEKTLQL